MPDDVREIVDALLPSVVVFGIAALGVVIVVWALRRARRSPRARAAAEALRTQAGADLVRLDEAVDELDLELGLSGALYGGTAPTSLRRARLTAQHVRDDAFAEYAALSQADLRPDEIRRASQRIQRRSGEALGRIEAARAEHAEWVRQNVSAADQVRAARERLTTLRATIGDPAALVAELSRRFDESEWRAAAEAAREASAAAHRADDALTAAEQGLGDPTVSVLADLAAAERAIRAAEAEARILEESHRLTLQAASAVRGELEAARSAVRQAVTTRDALEPADAERLGAEIRAVQDGIDALDATAERTPTATVDRVARLRDRLDLALGDARTAQQRLRSARTALPGTLASARGAVARGEAAIAHTRAGADARARLLRAQRELADARQAQDPVTALDAARRALRDAEDAAALADHARLGGR